MLYIFNCHISTSNIKFWDKFWCHSATDWFTNRCSKTYFWLFWKLISRFVELQIAWFFFFQVKLSMFSIIPPKFSSKLQVTQDIWFCKFASRHSFCLENDRQPTDLPVTSWSFIDLLLAYHFSSAFCQNMFGCQSNRRSIYRSTCWSFSKF